MKDFNLLPNDDEVAKWFDENIGAGDCSASSGIYKFRLWLKERQDLKTAFDKAEKTSQEFAKIEPQPKYEFEMFFKSEPTDGVKIDGWYPIGTDRIRKPENIEKYIESGILRRIKYAIFRCTASGNGGYDISKEIFFKEPSTDKASLEKVCEEANKNKPDQFHYYSVYETNKGCEQECKCPYHQALMRGEVIN